METEIIEYSSTFNKAHFYTKVVGLLNILNENEEAYYKIGYNDDGTIAQLEDIDETLTQLNNAIKELKSSTNEHTIISPEITRYLEILPDKDNNIIKIIIKGNNSKPFFLKGCILLRQEREKTRCLTVKEDIINFIDKQSLLRLKNLSSLEKLEYLFCCAFLNKSNIEELSIPENYRFIIQTDLNELKMIYEIIKNKNILNNTEESQAAKRGLSKIVDAIEFIFKSYNYCHSNQLFNLCYISKAGFSLSGAAFYKSIISEHDAIGKLIKTIKAL